MANSLDKFRKGVARWSGNIGSAGISDAVVKTVPLASTSGLPTDTAVMITVNRVDTNGKKTGNYEGIVGVVSGSNLIDCIRGVEGTAQAWTGGTVVEVLHTASNINELIDGILAEHNQDGTHKDTLVTSLKATGAEVNTGTEDGKIVTPKALADSTITTTTKTQTLTNKTLVQRVATYTPSGAGTTTLDLSTGNIHTVTMPANTQTLAISNATTGQCFLVEVNNVTSQGALTWFTTIRWVDGSAGTLTGTNGKRDVFGFRVTGTGTYDGYVVGQNI